MNALPNGTGSAARAAEGQRPAKARPAGDERPAKALPGWLSPGVLAGLARAGDGCAVVTAALAAHGLTAGAPFLAEGWWPGAGVWTAAALAVPLTLNALDLIDAYEPVLLGNGVEQARRLAVAWPAVLAVVLALAWAVGALPAEPLAWSAAWLGAGFAALLAWRMGLARRMAKLQRRGRLTRNVVVVGAGEHGRRLAERLRRADPSLKLLGLFDERNDRAPDYVAGHPVLGTLDDLALFVRVERVDQAVVALPPGAEARTKAWMAKLRNLPVDVRYCPDVHSFRLGHAGVSQLAGLPMLDISDRPLTGWSGVLKAVEDRVLAAAILCAVAPLMLVIAAAVKLSSPGPVLFRQQRYGFNNQVIEVLKFRSMRTDQDAATLAHATQAKRGDPRVTKVGAFLRKTSLDELPQFINVLKGEMSIVGPRPHAVAHNERYAALIDEYLGRHKVKPGITGWAQVNGLRGETDTLDKMERRVQHDLHYVEHWSLGFDVKIILTTLLVGFVHRNAY